MKPTPEDAHRCEVIATVRKKILHRHIYRLPIDAYVSIYHLRRFPCAAA
jgi:hypothetical protein